MPGFYLTNAAKADLKEIGRYTRQEWGVAQRDKYLGMLDECFHSIAVAPLSGRDCGDVREGYRRRSAGSHVVFFRPVGDLIEIVRVLHSRMDPERHLSDS
jgi:toxin ParE1/3/4